MSPEQQIERSVLAGKDRDELHTIAGAIGVKAATRMRKADLIDAILAAANGGERAATRDGAGRPAPTPPPVRSAARLAAPADDAIAALAAEEDALGADAADGDERRCRAPCPAPEHATATSRPPTAPTADATATTRRPRTAESADAADGIAAPTIGDDDPSADDDSTAPTTSGDDDGRATTSTPTTSGSRSATATAAGRRRRRGRGGQDQPGRRRAAPRRVPGRARSTSQGLLDLRDEGYGFLRAGGYLARRRRTSTSRRRRCGGSRCARATSSSGTSRPQASNEKYPALLRVDDINGMTPDDARDRPRFEDLTPLFPDEKLRLELPRRPARDHRPDRRPASRRSARASAG